jgi:mannose-1-phosphate guanylyltransferase
VSVVVSVTDAVVLVGGLGTRLRPLTTSTPKPLLPVGQEPMIHHTLDRLAAAGVSRVVLALGFAPDAFLAAFPEGRYRDLRLTYSVETELLGTGGAIALAARTAGFDKPFYVCNGDILTGSALSRLVTVFADRPAAAVVEIREVADPSRFGVVVTGGDGSVERFVEKPPPGHEPSRWINAGTYLLTPSAIAEVQEGSVVSIEREVFPALAAAGSLYAAPSTAYWLDAGTFASYRQANLDALAGRFCAPARAFGPGVHNQGRVVNSVLQAGAVVGEGSLVENCLVGPGARIGVGCRLRDLLVAPGVEVPDHTVCSSRDILD